MGVTAAVIGGSALLGAGMGLYGSYQSSRQQEEYLRAQKKAEEQRRAAERAASKVRFDEEKKTADKYADTLDTQATETQKNADISRQTENQELATQLDSSAQQSIAANKQAASMQGQLAAATSSIGARAANSGLKLSGSMATARTITNVQGNQQLSDAKNSINDSLRTVQSGSVLATQKIGQEYDTAMFNKNALTTKAADTRASYEAGGSAYNVYQANDVYSDQLSSIQQGLIQQQINANSDAAAFNMISGAFNGLSSGLSFGSSMMSLSSMFQPPKSPALTNGGSLLSSGQNYIGLQPVNKKGWDFSLNNGISF